MKSSFPKRVKRHSKENGFQMSMLSSEVVLWGRALHKYVNILVYTHTYEELFSKTEFTNLRWTFETHFL